MKKFSFKSIAEKIKTDKQVKIITAVSCCAVVAAITVVIAVGASGSRKVDVTGETTAKAINTTSPTETESSADITQPETVSESTVVETTIKNENTTAPKSSGSSSASGKTNNSSSGNASSGSSNSGSSSQKPNSDKNAQSNQPTQETPTAPSKKQWTQAEVDALVSEAKNYAIVKGFKINNNMSTESTSWNTPTDTWWCSDPLKRVKEEVDWNYNDVINQVGDFPKEAIEINIIAESYKRDGIIQWEIYVVY